MSAHRTLNDLFRAFDTVGPGRFNDPGDAGTITFDMWGQICSVVTAAAETRTLAQPTKPGIEGVVALKTDGGDLTLTVTGGYNVAADTTLTFANAGEYVRFCSIDVGGSYYWRIAGQGSDTLADTALKLAVTAVAAAGSTIGEGGSLVAGLNVVSAADNTKCVDLPATVAGTVVVVVSATVAKTLPIFPAVSSSIDNAATNAAITLGAATAYTTAILVADNATHWVSILGDTA